MRILIPALLLAACTITLAQEAPVPDPGPTKTVAYERLKLGEYWYGMYLPDGTTEGYSRLKFSETKDDGLHCDWELHISYDGGN